MLKIRLINQRFLRFEVLPFSLWELKKYFVLNNKPFTKDMFYDYLKWDGFPLRLDYIDEAAIRPAPRLPPSSVTCQEGENFSSRKSLVYFPIPFSV